MKMFKGIQLFKGLFDICVNCEVVADDHRRMLKKSNVRVHKARSYDDCFLEVDGDLDAYDHDDVEYKEPVMEVGMFQKPPSWGLDRIDQEKINCNIRHKAELLLIIIIIQSSI